MIVPQQYLAVNWTDGMKIDKSHFINTENFIIDGLRDIASLQINNYNFGLLPPLKGSGAELSQYEISKTATNQIQIRISYCQAVTPGGVRISITGEGLTSYALSEAINLNTKVEQTNLLNGSQEHFYVIIVVNPFEKKPSGEPDSEEIPIRQPHTQPHYDVQLVHVNNVNIEQLGAYHLVIGRIIKQGESYFKDEDFIPPCTSITSNAKLLQHYQDFGKALNTIQNLSIQIIQKIHFKNQKSTIAQNVKNLCEIILNYCSQHYFFFRNLGHQQAPANFVNAAAVLANYMYTAISILPEKEKEELLNYFFEWSDITQVIFLNQLSATIEINYDHYQVGAYTNYIKIMLNSMVNIWQKLNTLEYIGQHKENIVVKEERITKVVKEKKGWSILD
ncbi:MAG TPA: hypothetical protein PK772_00160 [Chitinophagaceae bacterium]|mgnify:CR=1 FL=1|nr:hypothetical protein [Chitinophagaceae bacterium]